MTENYVQEIPVSGLQEEAMAEKMSAPSRSARKGGGIALSALAFTSLTVTGVATMVAAPAADAAENSATSQPAATGEAGAAAYANGFTKMSVENLVGEFAYTQDAVSSNARISEMFCRAASALCATGVQEAVTVADEAGLTITFDGTAFAASVGGDDDAARQSKVMTCACSTNGPGGGAVATAEVTGVSLASLIG